MGQKLGALGRLLARNIATLGFIGYLPIAPGTFSTLAATIFFGILKPALPFHLIVLFVTIILGGIAAHQAEKLLGEKDSSHIVIDEFAGFALSVLFVPLNIYYYAAAFILFRFFDILKPPPIKSIEINLRGGAGIMADDLMAGVYTNILLQIWRHIQ